MRIHFLTIFSIIQIVSLGQNKSVDKISVKKESQLDTFKIYAYSARYVGGDTAMFSFINKNLIYPEKAKQEKIKGVVFIGFIVDKDGTLKDIKVLRGIPKCPEYDTEAVRIINSMPRWLPAWDGEHYTTWPWNLPIHFKP